MSSTRVRNSEPCGYENCGSRRFHIGDDGYTYCDQGHQQSERGTVIAEDTGEYVVYGAKSKKKGSDTESAASRVSGFSGPRAFDHYLLCLQLVLRKQLRWLIDVQNLPEELESLVRDLWALRLQKFQNRTTYASDTETEGRSSQVFSSQSESASGTESRSSRKRRRRGRVSDETSPSLLEPLALCYVGALLLRIPVTVADVHGWVDEGRLLYYRAHREIPFGMRERLPGEYERQLEPQITLQPQVLHQRISDIVSTFSMDFGMSFPSLNTSLILFRWIRSLLLPLEIYIATLRLARVLDVDFTFDSSSGSVVWRYPEARLMALIVVSTKLLLPFDDIERHPVSAAEFSTIAMDWNEWANAQKGDQEEKRQDFQLTFNQAFNFSESDCLAAADEKLDFYLSWYAENVASEDVRERGAAGKDADFRRALFRMFPVDAQQGFKATKSSTEAHDSRKLRRVQEKLVYRAPVQATQGVPRPGSSYRRFRQVEDLSGTVRVFYENAATLGGISLDGLVQAVFGVERKLQKREEALRRQAKSDE